MGPRAQAKAMEANDNHELRTRYEDLGPQARISPFFKVHSKPLWFGEDQKMKREPTQNYRTRFLINLGKMET